MNKRAFAIFMAMLPVLNGCAVHYAMEGIGRSEANINSVRNDLTNASPAAKFQHPGVVKIDRPLLIDKMVEIRETELPPELKQNIKLKSLGAQTVMEILNSIAGLAGLRIDMREILDNNDNATKETGSLRDQARTVRVAFGFEGTLSEALDELTAKIDASWRYDQEAGKIVVYRYEQRVLGVMLPPGKKDMNSSISIGGVGGGGGGASGASGSSGGSASSAGISGGSVSITSNMSVDPWTSLLDGVKALLGQNQASVAATSSSAPASSSSATVAAGSATTISGRDGYVIANRDLAQIVVVARPAAMEKIARYVDQTNRRFARNVLIDVRVLQIQDLDSGGIGFNPEFLLTRVRDSGLLGNITFNLTPGAAGGLAAQTAQLSLSGENSSTSLSIDVLVKALQSISNTSVRNQGQIVAINGQPASFQQANQISYLAQSQTTVAPNVGMQVSRQPGVVTVGFTANFLPTVLTDNRIMLQYQVQSSDLVGIRNIGDDQSFIQTPEVYSQSLQQQAYLKDGEILMLFGFERDRSEVSRTSELLSFFKSSNGSRIMTVIIIQARTAK